MPMRTESRPFRTRDVKAVSFLGEVRDVTAPIGFQKKQVGYRSTPLDARETAAQDGYATSSANVLRIIEAYDYEYNSRSNRNARVHPRDYNAKQASVVEMDWSGSTPTRTYSGHSVILIQGGDIETYRRPPQSSLESWASKMMRDASPTIPANDLFRSIAELKDAKHFLNSANYKPTTIKQVGGAYLNQVFGLIPTGTDIGKIMADVLNSKQIVQNLIDHEGRQVRRRRTRVIDEGHRFEQILRPRAGSLSESFPISDGSQRVGSVYVHATPTVNFGGVRRATEFLIQGNFSSELRMFSTFEYFVPRPKGLLKRFEKYALAAEHVLGGGINPSSIYDLTAWSWLFNWKVDIGSLLRYQQAVANNSVVASRSGWVYEAHLTLTGLPVNGAYGFTGAVTRDSSWTATSQTQTRRAGGPYAVIRPWELSSSQVAILTALGMSRWG